MIAQAYRIYPEPEEKRSAWHIVLMEDTGIFTSRPEERRRIIVFLTLRSVQMVSAGTVPVTDTMAIYPGPV